MSTGYVLLERIATVLAFLGRWARVGLRVFELGDCDWNFTIFLDLWLGAQNESSNVSYV